MKDAIFAALNRQIQHELGNAYSYEAVSLYFGHLNLRGLQSFMARQSREERGHARRLIRHVTARGGRVQLGALAAPRAEFASPLEVVRFVRELERSTTEAIHRLFDLGRKEADPALEVLMHWYVAEQVEEEQWADELLALMEQFHAHPAQVFMLDHDWARRNKE